MRRSPVPAAASDVAARPAATSSVVVGVAAAFAVAAAPGTAGAQVSWMVLLVAAAALRRVRPRIGRG